MIQKHWWQYCFTFQQYFPTHKKLPPHCNVSKCIFQKYIFEVYPAYACLQVYFSFPNLCHRYPFPGPPSCLQMCAFDAASQTFAPKDLEAGQAGGGSHQWNHYRLQRTYKTLSIILHIVQCIPDICQLFTQTKKLDFKFYTWKCIIIPPNKVKYALFVFNLENLTPERICLQGRCPWCPRQISGMAGVSGNDFLTFGNGNGNG